MSTHNICFYGEIRKIPVFFWLKKKMPYLSYFFILLVSNAGPDQTVKIKKLDLLAFVTCIYSKGCFHYVTLYILHRLKSNVKLNDRIWTEMFNFFSITDQNLTFNTLWANRQKTYSSRK